MFDSVSFFEDCTRRSLLARDLGFRFCRVSGLDSFEEALQSLTSANAFVCASDSSDGYLSASGNPHEKRVHTVFLAMRHPAHDMMARNECMKRLRLLFRQFVSRIIRERDRLELDCQFIDDKIVFNEVDRYFFPGCACAYFNITVTQFESIVYDDSQWIPEETP